MWASRSHYGSTYSGGAADLGTLFRVGPTGQNFALLNSFNGNDGAKPDDLKLSQATDGAFYGATSEGGPNGGGTLFRLDPATQALTTLYSFSSAAGVDAGLVAGRDGFWYGTTYKTMCPKDVGLPAGQEPWAFAGVRTATCQDRPVCADIIHTSLCRPVAGQ